MDRIVSTFTLVIFLTTWWAPIGESFAVEGKQAYSRLNFRGGRKSCSKRLAVHVNNAHNVDK